MGDRRESGGDRTKGEGTGGKVGVQERRLGDRRDGEQDEWGTERMGTGGKEGGT